MISIISTQELSVTVLQITRIFLLRQQPQSALGSIVIGDSRPLNVTVNMLTLTAIFQF